jgi:hypothetical protein
MKLLSVAVITLAAASAFAAKSNTEYFFQPAAGQSALELSYMMSSASPKTDSTPEVETKITSNNLMVDYAYGLADNSTVGGYITSASGKIESGGTETTSSGMGDLHAYWNGSMDAWHYGVDLGISLAKQKLDAATGNPKNAASGGMSIGGHFGGLWNSGAWNYGGNLTLMMPLERSYEIDGGTGGGKITGGMTTTLAGFGEYNYGMGFFWGELAYNMVGDTTNKPDAGGESKIKAESFPSLTIGATYDFNDMVTGMLSYAMQMHGAHDYDDAGTKLKAYNGTMMNIGARISF